MILSQRGVAFIQGYEKCVLIAYRDSHVPPIWTIGWGHTGPEVHDGLVWSQQCADLTFKEYDVNFAEHTVTTLVLVPLAQCQFDALISLVFNIGATAFKNSTLLRLLNSHDYVGAAQQFLVWDHSGGLVSTGLKKRREAELKMFETSDVVVSQTIAASAPHSLWQTILSIFTKKGS